MSGVCVCVRVSGVSVCVCIAVVILQCISLYNTKIELAETQNYIATHVYPLVILYTYHLPTA